MHLARDYNDPFHAGYIAGNAFIRNESYDFEGIGILFRDSFGPDLHFLNNTFLDNHALEKQEEGVPTTVTGPSNSVAYIAQDGSMEFKNNIIANSFPIEATGIHEVAPNSMSFTHNVIFNFNVPFVDDGTTVLTDATLDSPPNHTENLTIDPMFRPPSSDGFEGPNPRLSTNSTLIDSGTDILVPPDVLGTFFLDDIDLVYFGIGDPRFFGDSIDIGADEVGPVQTPTPTPTLTPIPLPTPIDCDVVLGTSPAPNPRCDSFDLLAIIQDRRGIPPNLDTDFNNDAKEDHLDLFLFSLGWLRDPVGP